MQPYATIEIYSFHNILYHLEPKYQAPSRNTLAEKMITAWNEAERVKPFQELQVCGPHSRWLDV